MSDKPEEQFSVPIKQTTVDMTTGETKEVKEVEFRIMPPAKELCPECARKHESHEPHDQQSLHFQYVFYGKHKRWPTWADAMAHCPERVQERWTEELEKLGVNVHEQNFPSDAVKRDDT